MSRLLNHAKRALTGILAVAMILTATPSYALAAEPDSDSAQIIENVEVVNEDAVVETSEGENTGETKEIENIEVDNNEDALQQETEEVEEAAAEVSEAAAEEGDELAEASDYTITITGENYSYQDGDGMEPAGDGSYLVSKDATSITIKNVTANDTYGIYKVTAKIGDADAVVKKDVTNLKDKLIQNGDGDYIITANEDGDEEIKGDVVVNVETKHVHTVTFVDANENNIGVTPLPGGEISAFIPNPDWDGTCKVFEGVDFRVEYSVPEDYEITKVMQDDVELEFVEKRDKFDNGHTPTVYQAKGITADSTISMYSRSTRHEIPVNVSNATVKWGVAEDAINKDLETINKKNCIKTLENDIYFTIDPTTGYHVASVMAAIGEEDPVMVVDDDEDGVYKLTTDQVKDCSGITIEIEENLALNIYASVDGESDLSKNNVTISGATKKTSGSFVYYEAKNTAVVFKYTVPTGKEIDSFKLLIGGEEAEYGEDFTVSTSSKPFTVTVNKEAVTKAWDEEKVAISLSITTGSKEQTITFEGTGVTFKEYTRAKITDGVLDEGGEEIIGDAITSESVKYNDDTIYFVVVYDKENYDLVSVKQGSTVLKPQQDEYYADAAAVEADAKTTSSEYYVTNKVTADAKVVATLKAKTADANSWFTVFDEADNSEFATKNAKLTDGVYVFNKNTNILTFTVTSDIGYIPEVRLGSVDEDGNFKYGEATQLTGELTTDKTYTKRIYTYSIPATSAVDKYIYIHEGPADLKTVTVAYDSDQVTAPTLSINGKYVPASSYSTDNKYIFHVPEFATVTVKSAANDYYKLTKVSLDGTEQKAAVKNGTLTFVVKSNQEVEYTSEGIVTIYKSPDDNKWESVADKAKIALASNETIYIKVCEGAYSEGNIATAEANGKNLGGFVNNYSDKIIVDPSCAQGLNTSNTVTVSLNGTFGTKTLNFVVAQNIDEVKADGFNSNNTVNQIAGSDAEYKLTLTPKTGDYSRLNAYISTVESAYDVNASTKITNDGKGNYFLKVSTYKTEGDDTDGYITKLASKPIKVIIFDLYSEKIYGEFEIDPIAPDLKAPTVKVSATTDIDATLTLALPKAAQDYENLWYKITGTANVAKGKKIADGMAESVGPLYVPANVELINVTLADGEFPQAGDGHAQKYDFEVSVLQLVENEENFEAENVFKAGSVKTVSVATKEPYYETKLGLTKKTTSFISGQKNITLAVPKYNSKTTYTQLGYADIIDADGQIKTTSYAGDKIVITNDSITLSDSSILSAGKYTLRVWPANPDRAWRLGDEARLSLTVKRAITSLTVSVPSTRVYKKANAAVTVKPTVTYNGNSKSRVPAVKKVTWSITDKNGDEITSTSPLFEKVTINKSNGAVTVAKDFVLSSNVEDNKFMIKAVAADFAGRALSASSSVIEISSDVYTIDKVSLRSASDLSTDLPLTGEISSYTLNNTVLFVNDAPVDTSLVTVKASDAKNLVLAQVENGYGISYIGKSGTYKITVTANDGGKSSMILSFTVKEGEPASYGLSAYDYTNYENEIEFIDEVANPGAAPAYIELNGWANADSVTKATPSLKIKSGAVKVTEDSYPGNKYMLIRPTAAEVKIDLSYKDPDTKKNVTDTYTISINKADFVTLTAPKQLDVWALADSQNYTCSFTTDKDLDDTAEYKMAFTYTDAIYKASSWPYAYYALRDALNNAEVAVDPGDKTKFDITATIASTSIPKGTYKLYGVLTKEVDSKYVPVSDPVEVKVVATAAKAPSAAIATAAISLNAEEGAEADIPFKTYKEVQRIADEVTVYNNNDNGVVNSFVDYFEVKVVDGSGLRLKLKSDVTAEKIKDIKDSDLTGWVEYIVVGKDSSYTVKCEKITVKLVPAE